MKAFSGLCAVCGGESFSYSPVLWPELVNEWQLSPIEVSYVNRQQGYCCKACGNNLRSMALAKAIVGAYKFSGNLAQFVETDIGRSLKMLEINEAGGLTSVLSKLPGHCLVRYPECDMNNLSFGSESFDIVIHSDTLEHINNPTRGLSECRRVLSRNGVCAFTVPIIVERLTRSRLGLPSSYHGQSGVPANDQVVYTEFGADVWQTVLKSSFQSCELVALEYPAGLAILAKK